MNRKDLKTMKKKVVTAFMMAALGSSLVFSQAAMAADTTAKTETSEDEVKEIVKTETKSELPVTFDNPILFVILGIAVLAIIIVAIRIKKLSKKNEK